MSGTDLFERPSVADDGARNVHDYYPTPAWMTLSLLFHHPIVGTVFEPCAGDGAIGVSPTSGGYFNNLGSLRSLGLLSYPRPSEVAAQPVLFLEH